MLKVTIELTAHPDLLGAIERLTAVFGGRAEKAIMPTPQAERAVMPAPQVDHKPTPQADPKPTPQKKAPKATPAPAEKATEKEVPAEETKPQKPAPAPAHGITVEELRAKVQETAMSGKRAEVKDLLTEFGAANVSALETDKYDEFLTRLKSL